MNEYTINEGPFEPRKKMSDRYSINNFTDEQIKQLNELAESKNDLIKKYIEKGYTKDEAEITAMRILYIPGFSGPTFKD
jgi:hypothetical protein